MQTGNEFTLPSYQTNTGGRISTLCSQLNSYGVLMEEAGVSIDLVTVESKYKIKVEQLGIEASPDEYIGLP